METNLPESPGAAPVTVIAGHGVPIESAALDQLRAVAALPGCIRAVGMPDLHPGRGIPVGAAFAFRDVLHPGLVGGDAGCGVRFVHVRRARFTGDALVRRVEAEMAETALPDCDPVAVARAAWTHGPRGLLGVDGLPESLGAVIEALVPGGEAAAPDAGPPLPEADGAAHYGRQLGTAGGGNHFVEVARVSAVANREAARALGLSTGEIVVVAHSGSRHLGNVVAARWRGAVLTTPADRAGYRAALDGAVRYAETNRLVLAWRLLTALGAARPSSLGASFDLVHNTVTEETVDGCPCLVHRKGCAPAPADRPTIVLGTRGTETWLMTGTGAPESLASVAHGAGRRLSRADAVSRLRDRYPRASLTRTRAGGTVLCDDTSLLYAEHPDAYKAIEPVVDSLESAGAARRLAALLPVLNVKHTETEEGERPHA
jgi:release factor H-coupled RctB family protein